MKVVAQGIELLWVTPDPVKAIEIAGRTCYKSEDQITDTSAAEFVQRMVKSGHHAMIEHASASFRIVCDRGITHEIVRHRLASYAQESTRYCNYAGDKFGKECTFIRPSYISGEAEKYWEDACLDAEDRYFLMLKEGCTPQIARSVLPNCLKTEIVMTCNFREWRHFISLRGTKAAHPDIRPIAYMIWKELLRLAEPIFIDLDPIL